MRHIPFLFKPYILIAEQQKRQMWNIHEHLYFKNKNLWVKSHKSVLQKIFRSNYNIPNQGFLSVPNLLRDVSKEKSARKKKHPSGLYLHNGLL